MIAFILKSIASGLWQPIAKLLGYGAAYFKGRADAKAKADLDGFQEAAARAEAGRKGAAKAKADLAAGATPADVVRKNDGAWK